MSACASLFTQLFLVSGYPIWSILIMVLDGMVIYALSVHGEEYARAKGRW